MIKEYLRKKALKMIEESKESREKYWNCKYCIHYKEIVSASESTTGYSIDKCLYNDGIEVPYWREWKPCFNYKKNKQKVNEDKLKR